MARLNDTDGPALAEFLYITMSDPDTKVTVGVAIGVPGDADDPDE